MDESDKLNNEKLAIIIGASNGFGLEMAKLFAEHGFNILITDDSDNIFETRDKLIDFGVDVEAIRADLSRFTEVEKIYEALSNSDYALDSVVLNAPLRVAGKFVDNDLQTELKIIQSNCTSIVHLSKLVIPEMLNNKRGKILYASTQAEEIPGSYSAVYAASSAFVQAFADEIKLELKDSSITITSVQPELSEANWPYVTDMAKEAFEAMISGKAGTVTGPLKNKLKAAAARIFLSEDQQH